MFVYIYECGHGYDINKRMHTYMYIYLSIYLSIYLYTYVCMHVCIYACMYVRTHVAHMHMHITRATGFKRHSPPSQAPTSKGGKQRGGLGWEIEVLPGAIVGKCCLHLGNWSGAQGLELKV